MLAAILATLTVPALGRDKPSGTSRFYVKYTGDKDFAGSQDSGQTGGQFSKVQIERFRCESSGDPSGVVDISCDTTELGQDFAPDNEIAVSVDPEDPDHIVAGSNDYHYRFNNSTGARQAIVPTG